MRVILLATLALASGPAFAQSNRSQAQAWCEGRDNATAEQRAAGCTRLLQDRQARPADQARYYAIRGMARLRLGQDAAAMEDFTQATRLNPRDVESFVELGDLRERLVGPGQGRAAYDEALRLAPGIVDAQVTIGQANARTGHEDAARAYFDRAVRIDPRSVAALRARAASRDARGDQAGALADLTAAIAIAPRDVELLMHRAMLLAAMDDHDGAIRDTTAVIALNPGVRTAAAYAARGSAQVQRGNLEAAVADFTEALRIAPAGSRLERGEALYALGRLDEALADINAELAAHPQHGSAYLSRAQVHAAMGDMPGALADLERQARIEGPLRPWVVPLERGIVQMLAGNAAAARAEFDAVLLADPNNVHALSYRCAIRLRQDDQAGAADCEKAVRTAGSSEWSGTGVPYVARAAMRMAAGDAAGAGADLAEALRRNPRDAHALQLSALLRAADGNAGGAAADATAARRFRPNAEAEVIAVYGLRAAPAPSPAAAPAAADGSSSGTPAR